MSTAELRHEELDITDILLEEVPEKLDEKFQVDTLEKAAWAAHKYLEAKEQMEERWEQARGFKEKIDLWFQRAISEDESTMDYMMTLLRPYVEQEVAKLHRGKTLKAPGINITLRKKPNKIEIQDEKTAMEYCEEYQPQIIQTKKSLSKAEINKLLNQGELIPGVEVLMGEQELQIKAK